MRLRIQSTSTTQKKQEEEEEEEEEEAIDIWKVKREAVIRGHAAATRGREVAADLPFDYVRGWVLQRREVEVEMFLFWNTYEAETNAAKRDFT